MEAVPGVHLASLLVPGGVDDVLAHVPEIALLRERVERDRLDLGEDVRQRGAADGLLEAQADEALTDALDELVDLRVGIVLVLAESIEVVERGQDAARDGRADLWGAEEDRGEGDLLETLGHALLRRLFLSDDGVDGISVETLADDRFHVEEGLVVADFEVGAVLRLTFGELDELLAPVLRAHPSLVGSAEFDEDALFVGHRLERCIARVREEVGEEDVVLVFRILLLADEECARLDGALACLLERSGRAAHDGVLARLPLVLGDHPERCDGEVVALATVRNEQAIAHERLEAVEDGRHEEDLLLVGRKETVDHLRAVLLLGLAALEFADVAVEKRGFVGRRCDHVLVAVRDGSPREDRGRLIGRGQTPLDRIGGAREVHLRVRRAELVFDDRNGGREHGEERRSFLAGPATFGRGRLAARPDAEHGGRTLGRVRRDVLEHRLLCFDLTGSLFLPGRLKEGLLGGGLDGHDGGRCRRRLRCLAFGLRILSRSPRLALDGGRERRFSDGCLGSVEAPFFRIVAGHLEFSLSCEEALMDEANRMKINLDVKEPSFCRVSARTLLKAR